ncbi:MAG: acetyl-CoA C-acyltransferase, partial [SAR324 cluster bacterium]|nr:acetyl-CoA C-acyltransferase [SAR324 cluster bacterium]
MSEKENIVITGMARTPMGAFQGTLKDASCAELGAASIRAALERSRVGADEVSETIMGCVLPAGQGQAPARQAALGAEMPLSVCCTTVNKMCGSGMKSAMLAHDLLLGGEERILVAGGMESMTNAPYLLPRARSGMRLGHGEVVDHMFLDGLEDAYDLGKLMGTFAEATAGRYGFSREAQDEFAIRSLTRAKKAIEEGIFKDEIVPITIKGRKGDTVVESDETPLKANLEKIPTLKPAFAKDGTVTPANSSSISDGAAALVMMREYTAEKCGILPIARIIG